MVESAASLIGRQGVNATSFSEVLAASGAPRGSIYHHFPEGKEQLSEDAVRLTAERVVRYLEAGRATTPAGVLEHFVALWRKVVVDSGGAAGCAIAGVAVDSGRDAPVMAVVRAAFDSWIALVAGQLAATGLAPARARAVALVAVAALEGALILCRAEGGPAPLDAVAGELDRLVR